MNMQPTSTANDTVDGRRRRGPRWSTGVGNSSHADHGAGNVHLTMDSPAERVAARKRKMRGRQGAGVGLQSYQEQQDTSSFHQRLEEEAVIPSPLRVSSDETPSQHHSYKKKLSPANSVRSLDSAAACLERERTQRIHKQQRRRQSQSFHQRPVGSLPPPSNDDSQKSSQASIPNHPTAVRRPTLPDIKSIFRNMLPSKKSNTEHHHSLPFASERNARMVGKLQTGEKQRNVRSEHRRGSQPKQHKRRGSDSNLFQAVERMTNDQTLRRRSDPTESDAAVAAALASPGIIKKLWQKGTGSSQLKGKGSSQPMVIGSSQRMSTTGSAAVSGSAPLQTTGLLSSEEEANISRVSSGETTDTDSFQGKGEGSQGPLAVFSPRLKRKTKRAQLVQELSSRDTLRVRDRARPLGSETQQQHQPPLPRHHSEFSTGEEWWVEDQKLPFAFHRRSASDDHDKKSRRKSPFDTSPSTLPETNPPVNTILHSTSAAILSSATLSSGSALAEMEGTRVTGSLNKAVHEDTLGGHYSWPASLQQVCGAERRSSSLPSKAAKAPSEGKHSSKHHDSRTKDVRSKRESSPSASRAYRKVKSSGSADRRSRRKTCDSSKSKSRKGGSVPPPTKENLPRRRSVSLETSRRKSKSHRSDEKDRGKEHMSSSKSRRHRRKDSTSSAHDRSDQGQDSRKSPKSPLQCDRFFEDSPEGSLTVDGIARLDESGRSQRSESIKACGEDTGGKKKKKSRKKSEVDTTNNSRAATKQVRKSQTEELLSGKSSKKTEKESPRLGTKSGKKSPKTGTRTKDAKENDDMKAANSDGTARKLAAGNTCGEAETRALPLGPNDDEAGLVTDKPFKANDRSDNVRKASKKASIARNIGKATIYEEDSSCKSEDAVTITGQESHDSRSRWPALAKNLSVELSTDSSKRKGTPSTDEQSNGVLLKASSTNSQQHGKDVAVDQRKQDLTTQSMTRAKRLEPPVDAGQISSLDAIADDTIRDIDSKGYKGRDNRDALRLQAADIFDDSPNVSPLAHSSPRLWESSDSDVERLASSMPNLDYHHWSNTPDSKSAALAPPKKKKPAGKGGDIFQDDSDDSPGGQDMPDLEPMCDSSHIDVMTEIAEQIEERHEKRALQPRSYSDDRSIRASLISEYSIASPERMSPLIQTGGGREHAAARLAKAENTGGKHDRGPRKPQRRSDSFGEDTGDSQLERESSVAAGSEFEGQQTDAAAVACNSRDMQFLRALERGWVQTPFKSARNAEESELSTTAQPFATSERTTYSGMTNIPQTTTPGLRRRASMSDLEGARAITASERWNASVASSSTVLPPHTRQSYPTTDDIRVSSSLDSDELRHLHSLPRGSGVKQLARTYLPVSLQSAARRHERARRRSFVTEGSAEMTTRASVAPSRSPNLRGRARDDSVIAVGTGLSNMFEMFGDLEEDLAKFENQIAFLRAQRARLQEEDASEGEETKS